MNFLEDRDNLILQLQHLEEFDCDIALRKVVELLQQTNSKNEFFQNYQLINRICVESVEKWGTINLISNWLEKHKP